ncbi:hypothetical protein G3I76_32280, partial [Streptomyces sp. SID11233]|nr:hypothetical protein [Streptomyces sp. SID11233]
LLRFPGQAQASYYQTSAIDTAWSPEVEPLGSSLSYIDQGSKQAGPKVRLGITAAYAEEAPFGARQVRHAYIQAGDTVAFVIMDRKGKTPALPFHQTVVLQSQLLY